MTMTTTTTTPDPTPGLKLPEGTIPHKLPRPERTRVLLVNADGDATPHVYSETRLTDQAHRGTLGYEFLYTCTKTNQRRRYGFERIPGLWDDEPAEVAP